MSAYEFECETHVSVNEMSWECEKHVSVNDTEKGKTPKNPKKVVVQKISEKICGLNVMEWGKKVLV